MLRIVLPPCAGYYARQKFGLCHRNAAAVKAAGWDFVEELIQLPGCKDDARSAVTWAEQATLAVALPRRQLDAAGEDEGDRSRFRSGAPWAIT